MLAPVRHYVRDSLPPPDPTYLGNIRNFYYRAVRRCSEQRDEFADIIISDHLNIEHIVSFGLAHTPDGEGEIHDICWQFLKHLQTHLPRPTTLAPAIFNITNKSSASTLKAHCLYYLGWLYSNIHRLTDATNAFQAAEDLHIAVGDHVDAVSCVIHRAHIYRMQGRFIQSQYVLENLQRSDSWEHLNDSTKSEVRLCFDLARMFTFTASADELFVKSMDDPISGLLSKGWHWRAKLSYDGDIAQIKMHLNDLLLQCTDEHLTQRRDILKGLAEIASREGRLSEAMDIMQKIIGSFEGHPGHTLWYTVVQAVVASNHGNYDLARELIRSSSGSFEFLMVPSARTFLHRTYNAGRIELAAGEYDKAESYFATAVESCDMQDNLQFKALILRGLGEVAFLRGNSDLAAQQFAETRSLCAEMGVPAQHLCRCMVFYIPPDRLEGWVLFLEGRSPFAS
ncbi:hypothetical protein M405DRAFT_865615 [Rhizopogon salebrosus TDB-379]|nr:hypothetical protein M405DRAFT_865615 [Rhizopogon salebrosus TDB-379]